MTDRVSGAAAPGGRLTPSFRPRQLEREAPCQVGCAVSGDVRGWIGLVAQHGKSGLSRTDAYRRAWERIADRNPFPSVLGRVCPHPCETDCNRSGLDEPVSINALERFLGDWALANKLPLRRLETDAKPESLGVVGAGPSGLSFAYQMARRGYSVTIYDRHERPGGMLRYGIPNYRLPPHILDAEIERILDLGVALRCDTTVGRDTSLAKLEARHDVLYIGIGAQTGRDLGIPGDDDTAVRRGTDYLHCVNRGEQVALGSRVAVIGGGNTAIDAARTARRAGAEVTVVYRRSRDEMPAIASEVDDALAEGVRFEFLAAPLSLQSNSSGLLITLQRMQLGEPDESGRARPLPLPRSAFTLAVETVIAAVSQEPAWSGLESLQKGGSGAGVWAGGDVLHLGIVGDAVVQGRQAAEALHAQLRRHPIPESTDRPLPPVAATEIRTDFYELSARANAPRLDPAQALREFDTEVKLGIAEEQFLAEVARCFSCGSCFGCRQCWMFCTALSFAPVDEAGPGAYFSLSLDACRECGKCIDLCPCSFLQVIEEPAGG